VVRRFSGRQGAWRLGRGPWEGSVGEGEAWGALALREGICQCGEQFVDHRCYGGYGENCGWCVSDGVDGVSMMLMMFR
jgi:hypothetical protein